MLAAVENSVAVLPAFEHLKLLSSYNSSFGQTEFQVPHKAKEAAGLYINSFIHT